MEKWPKRNENRDINMTYREKKEKKIPICCDVYSHSLFPRIINSQS
jgi:hypothetical protein